MTLVLPSVIGCLLVEILIVAYVVEEGLVSRWACAASACSEPWLGDLMRIKR